LGYSVTRFADGRSAYAAIAARPPQILVTDESMQDLQGVHLVQKLCDEPRLRRVSVILFVGLHAYPEWLLALYSSLGKQIILGTITRPFAWLELTNMVKKVEEYRQQST